MISRSDGWPHDGQGHISFGSRRWTRIHGVHHTWCAGDQGAGEMGIRGYPVIVRGKHRRFT